MDLNLYPVFLAILRHGSVSRAGEALGLSQPATSNALTRLRRQLGDPLFVRTRDGMLPTRFAKDIAPEIERAVAALAQAASDRPLDPPPIRSVRRHFTLVMSDLEETLFLPALIAALAAEAPGVTLEIRPFQRENLRDDLERGRIDFILAHLPTATKNLRSRTLSKQEFVGVARTDHPALSGPMTLERYAALGHILVAPDRGGRRGVIDETLKELGLSRRVVCSVPHFLSACLLAAQSDHLLTVPRLLAQKAAGHFPLRLFELPLSAPGFAIGLHWYRTRDGDLEHASFAAFLQRTIMASGA